MPQVQLIARHSIKPGHEDEVFGLLAGFTETVREEAGCLAFDTYLKLGSERSYVLLERYTSREALAAHRASAHFRQVLLAKIVPLLSSRTIEEYDVPE